MKNMHSEIALREMERNCRMMRSTQPSDMFVCVLPDGILLMWLGQTFDIAQIVALALFNITCVDSFNHPYLV